MVTTNGATDNATILVGWKAIAEALGVTVQTAIRWRRERALPVYKVVGTVRASDAELRAWERQNVNDC